MTEKVLKRFGHSVLLARDGEEALAVFETRPDRIDLVILDLVMPRKSGQEVYAEIRSQHPESKILLLSGYAGEAITEICSREQSRTDCPQKPFPPLVLAQKVRSLLDRP